MMITLKAVDCKKTETIWKENGFFKDQRTDLTIFKSNFPENTALCESGKYFSN